MVELLVSVRNPHEALAALEGGANWIDVKEPSQGPLGMAKTETLEQILKALPVPTPTSAALGEARDFSPTEATLSTIKKYNLIKIGLSNVTTEHLKTLLAKHGNQLEPSDRVVLAAYADHGEVQGISPWEAYHFCLEQKLGGLLIDTFQKKGQRLFDWLKPEALADLARACQENQIRFGLAGSLQIQDLDALLEISPHLIGIRGAACIQNNREGEICPDRVRLWKKNLEQGAQT